LVGGVLLAGADEAGFGCSMLAGTLCSRGIFGKASRFVPAGSPTAGFVRRGAPAGGVQEDEWPGVVSVGRAAGAPYEPCGPGATEPEEMTSPQPQPQLSQPAPWCLPIRSKRRLRNPRVRTCPQDETGPQSPHTPWSPSHAAAPHPWCLPIRARNRANQPA
jgi:hypothetical protein